MAEQARTFTVEDADIMFKNFSGEETPFNAAGKRNFCVKLDPVTAAAMADDGWNIKLLKAREENEGDEDQAYIKISVGFKARPPQITMIGSITGNRTQLTEETVGVLDWADIVQVDLIAREFSWEVNGNRGITPYVQTLFVTILENELDIKYGAQS
jgi:hypothetical protein